MNESIFVDEMLKQSYRLVFLGHLLRYLENNETEREFLQNIKHIITDRKTSFRKFILQLVNDKEAVGKFRYIKNHLTKLVMLHF